MEWILGLLVLMVLLGVNSKRKAARRAPPRAQRVVRSPRPRTASGVSVTFGANPDDAPPVRANGRRRAAGAEECWLPFGANVTLGSTILPGPIYFGRGLPAVNGRGIEPALIDPDRKVSWGDPDHAGQLMGYWPSYGDIDARCRSAYLWWLSDGRRHPGAAIGYVFLFFYGLERRALFDAQSSAAAREEIPRIAAEALELLSLYGPSSGSFRGYASRFLIALAMLYPDQVAGARLLAQPALGEDRSVTAELIKGRLGRTVKEEHPIPPSLAVAWVRSDYEFRLTTPALRCPEAFDRLLAHVYHQQWPEGLLVKPNKTPLRPSYRPASGGLSDIPLTKGQEFLPDITVLSGPRKRIQEVIDTALQLLEPYSRYVGRRGSDPHSLAAIALLPEPLRSEARRKSRAVLGLKTQLNELLGSAPTAQVPAERVLCHAPGWAQARLSKRDYVQLTQVLAMEGCGIEPDVRFGGASPQPDAPCILFRLPQGSPSAPSEAYAVGALMMGLAVAVSSADGTISPEEEAHLESLLRDRLHLDEGEKTRLRAHAQWLMASPPRIATLAKRVEVLTKAQRQATGDLLVLVAAADGYIDPSEMKLLTRLFRALGLDEHRLHDLAHAAATAPVAVGPPGAGRAGGVPIPQSPGEPGSVQTLPPRHSPTRIDPDVLARKLSETDAVVTLLAGVFAAPEQEEATVPDTLVQAEAGPSIAGLDAEHTQLLQALANRGSISVGDFEVLADREGLLAGAAFERLNEAAFEACDAPLLEEGAEGDYDIDTDTYEELVSHGQ